MTKSDKKQIRVVSVINPSKVGINCGSNDGISVGDTILFYALGDEITDPETGENLGQLEIAKGKGRVTHVQPKLAIVESVRLKRKVTRTDDVPSSWWTLNLARYGTSVQEEEPAPFDDIYTGDLGRLV